MTDTLRIRHVAPTKLAPHPANPNQMTPTAYERLKRILAEFGLVEPLVYNRRFNRLVGGHHRRQAAIELGLKTVPVVDVDLDADREAVLMVALNNREAQGTFDAGTLVAVLGPVEETPLLEASGFDFDQYQRLQLQAAVETKQGREGFTPPKPEAPKSRRGDIYELGPHLLVVGDALDPHSYRYLPEPAQLCFTDPPYGVDYVDLIESLGNSRLSKSRPSKDIEGDTTTDPAQYAAFVLAALTRIAEHCTGAVYLCHATAQAGAVAEAWAAAGYLHSTTIAWVKQHFVMGRGDYHWQWEPILYGWPTGRRADRFWIGDRTLSNVWEHDRPKRSDQGRRGPSNVWRYDRPGASREHPTMKPVSLVEHALRNSSEPGRWILDPFGGAGSTLIAAENLNRRCYIIDNDPGYADVIVARYRSLEAGEIKRRRR